MKSTSRKMFMAAAAVMISACAFAQTLYTFDNDELGGVGTVSTGVSATDLTLVNGTSFAAACPEGFNVKSWSTDASWSATGPAVEMTLTPDPGVTMTVMSASTNIGRNNNGPVKMNLAFSTDGGLSWNTSAELDIVDHGSCFDDDNYVFDFDDFTTTDPVIFRWYGWQAGNAAGTAYIHESAIYGTTCDLSSASVNFADYTAACVPVTVPLVAEPVGDGYIYQWYRNGVVIDGATSSTYDAYLGKGNYSVEVSSAMCTVTSDELWVRIYSPDPVMVMAPDGTDLCAEKPLRVKANFGFASTHAYQWYKNGEMIEGATAARYDASEPGEYYCNVYAEYPGCSYWSESIFLTEDCRLGETLTAFDVYPNPSAGTITVNASLATGSESATVEVINMLGEVIYVEQISIDQEFMNFDVTVPAGTANGIYQIKVIAGNSSAVQQFVLAR